MKDRLSGLMISEIRFANMPVLLNATGLDFIVIDSEHGAFDFEDISAMVMTAKLVGLKTIIRLPGIDRGIITKLMDAGATGVLLPMTDEASQIEEVVSYAKYAPIGKRGISTMRAHTAYDPKDVLSSMAKANEMTKVYAQIETIKGLKNLKDIMSVQGMDGVFLGPNDLSSDYGCLDDPNAHVIHEAIKRIASESAIHDKTAGIITSNEQYLKTAKQSHFSMYCVGSELALLSKGAKQTVKTIMED